MTRNKLRWFWYLPAVAVLCLIVAMLHPSIVYYSETFCFACMYIVIETIVLVVVLSILRKLNMLTSWKAIAYYAIVVGGSLAINLLLSPINGENILPFILSIFAIFVFLNFGLLEIIFDVSFWKASLVSIIAGLLNALMIAITITVY